MGPPHPFRCLWIAEPLEKILLVLDWEEGPDPLCMFADISTQEFRIPNIMGATESQQHQLVCPPFGSIRTGRRQFGMRPPNPSVQPDLLQVSERV